MIPADQKMTVTLKVSSWWNLFDSLHRSGSTINSSGNCWAAIQEAERQTEYPGILKRRDQLEAGEGSAP